LFEVIHQRVVGRKFLTVHLHTHALVLRRDHQRLLAHTANHVERLLHLAVPRQRLHVGRHAAFDRGAFFLLDREEAVGRAEPIHSLMRPPVVVVLHPPREAFPRLVECFEARLDEKLVLERLPQPLDFPQCLGMLRRTTNVMDVILPQFLLEGRLPAPVGVLPAVVGQHLLWLAVFAHRTPVDLQHILRRVTAVDPQSHDVPGVVIQECDDVRHFPKDVVVRDVALPHLIRRGTLEPAWRWLPLVAGLLRGLHQPGACEFLPYLVRTGPHPEPLPQQLRDPPHPLPGLSVLERHDLLPDRRGQLPRCRPRRRILQPGHAALTVLLRPVPNGLRRHTQFPAHGLRREPFLQVQLHRTPPHLRWVRTGSMIRSRQSLPRPLFLGLGIRERTPRGRMPLRSSCFLFRFHR